MKNKYLNHHIFSALRPKQWTKNLSVFSAPLFSFSNSSDIWIAASAALIGFCLLSSSIYLLNDVVDLKNDRNHPFKKYRSIASGKVSAGQAIIVSLILLIISLLIASFINLFILIVFIAYLIIQYCYCFYLKKKPILDIFCISAGFLLRAISGGIAANLIISPWFLLSIASLALFLAIEKRKAELIISLKTGKVNRKVLKYYSIELLSRFENVVTTSSFISYSLWASGPALKGAPTQWMLITVPFVLIGIFRYQLISEKSNLNLDNLNLLSCENPEEVLLKDKPIKIIVSGWIITTIIVGFFSL